MTGKKYLSSADLSLMTTSTKPPARPLSMPSSRVSNLTRSNSAGALVTNPDSEEVSPCCAFLVIVNIDDVWYGTLCVP